MDDDRTGTDHGLTGRYPRFSEREFERRRSRVREMMDEQGVDVLVVHGNATYVQYLTNYPDAGAFVVFFADPGEQTTLFVDRRHYSQYAREASVMTDVRVQQPDPAGRLTDRIAGAVPASATVGVVGDSPQREYSWPHSRYRELRRRCEPRDFVDVTSLFVSILAVKSDEEIERVRTAAGLTDRGLEALVERAEPGVAEYELEAAFKCAVLDEGGESPVSVLSSAPMRDPDPNACLPWKRPSRRRVQAGDVINLEFSASCWGYDTQIQRPIAVTEQPTETYRSLYEIASETYRDVFDAIRPGNSAEDVHDAVSTIENSAFHLSDVALHGGGNGYLPPFVGTGESDYWPGTDDPLTENWEFAENQVVVVQPNVVSGDGRYALMLGTTAVVREGGAENLHEFPLEFVQV